MRLHPTQTKCFLSLFGMLSLTSTSTSRSDRSAQAKPPSAMSSDSVSTSAELSPELRVSSLQVVHWVPASSLINNNYDWSMTLLFSAPFRLSPKLLPRYANSWILPNMCLITCCTIYLRRFHGFRSRDCPIFRSNLHVMFPEGAERFRQRGTTVTSKWNGARHG